jgi:hypothetical protein
MSTARHQNTDGQSEIAIRIVEEILRGVINYRQDNWVAKLPMLEFAINNSVSSATGLTPFFCEQGRNPLVPLDLSPFSTVNAGASNLGAPLSHIARAKSFLFDIASAQASARDSLVIAKEKMIRFANVRRRTVDSLKIGSEVFLKLEGIEMPMLKARPSKKLGPVWFGPLKIIKKVSPVSYKLALPVGCRIHDVFHVDRLKPSAPGLDKSLKARKLPAVADSEYEVEAILAERIRYRKREFLIHWKGYSELMDSTWEAETTISPSAPAIIKKWRSKHKALSITD